MKTVPILTSCLIISVAYNVYQFINTKPPEPITCPTLPGFGETRLLSKDEAEMFINQYRMSLKDPDDIIGGVITRTAFDEILCTKSCNSIAYSFARDSSGETGPANNGVFAIFSGVNVIDENGTIRVTDLSTELYVPRNWCPPSCIP